MFIDSTWDDPAGSGHTNTNVYNGVTDAINKWNNTADQNSCYGRPYINYWFQLNQANSAQADVKITKYRAGSDCAETLPSPPYLIKLSDFYASRDAYAVISPNVQHELGHAIGLDDAYYRGDNSTACESVTSIMREVQDLYSCLPVAAGTAIKSIDVAQSNRNLTNRSSCQNTWDNPNTRDGVASCIEQNFCSQNHYYNPDPCSYGSDNGGCGAYAKFLSGQGPEGSDCCSAPTPIIVDLGQDGYNMTDASSGVTFDFFGIGKAIQLAWTASKSDNAFLVLDRDGDGLIDSGREMFGNITDQPVTDNPNGFLALGVFDRPEEGGNGDGIIDERDAVFDRLLLWRDSNHDGISQPNELLTLRQAGIIAISLKYEESRWSDVYGNAFRYRARVVLKGNHDKWAYDVFLALPPQ